jgi:hypothetical protein
MNTSLATITLTGTITMTSNRKTVLMTSAITMVVRLATVSAQPAAPDGAHQAALQALSTFRQLAVPTDNNPNGHIALGLNVPGEADHAGIGAPVNDYIIGLIALQKWDGRDPQALLRPTGRVIYPITTDGVTRSSVTLAQKNGQWTAVVFGSADEAQARSRIRANLSAQGPGGDEVGMQVRIPDFQITFLAQRNGQDLQFTPISTLPGLGIEAGKTEPARQLLLRLQPEAKLRSAEVPH